MKISALIALQVIFIFLIGFFSPLSATEGEFSPKIQVNKRLELQEKQELIQKMREENTAKREERKASISAKLAERKKLVIMSQWERMIKRLEAMIDRLDKLVQRLESRVSTIEANNEEIDTTAVEAKLAEAKLKLTEAKSKLSALKSSGETAVESENPKETFVVLRDSFNEVKTLLVEVHKLLVHLIGDVRGLRVGKEDLDGATPTVTITVTPTLTATPTVTPTLTITSTP